MDNIQSAAQPTASERALQTIPNHDLTPCCHRHHLLGTAAEADDINPGHPVPVTLYHWSPPTVRPTKITTISSPDVLQTIKGFTSLGTFVLPSGLDLSKTLPELLTATDTATDMPPSPEPTPQLLASLISQLPVPEQGDRVRFFSFPVWSDSPTDPFGGGLLRPVFKWAKPNGVYRTAGFWEADLHTAVEDGEWNGGRGLMLLVSGVSEEILRIVKAGEWRFRSLGGMRRAAEGGVGELDGE